MRDHLHFFVNGQPHHVRGEDVFITVSDYLRSRLASVGTKVVCAEGDCGACTVLVGRRRGGRVSFDPIDSCIQFLHQIDGTHLVTVEGLAQGDVLHPVQQSLVDHHGSQCGYCTPGIAMALAGWTEAGCPVEPASPRIALTGNLCRCTGYQSVFAATDAIAQMRIPLLTTRYEVPLETGGEPLRIVAKDRLYFAPTTLAEAVAFKAEHPEAVIVAGATELGVWRNKRGFDPPVLLSLSRVVELDSITVTAEQMTFGANATWAQIEKAVHEPLPEFHAIVQRFGSPQIRQAGTLVGNIANGSPISDAIGFLSVLDAEIELAGPRGSRLRSINGFYTGYKQKDMAPDELIARIILPLPQNNDRIRLTKVAQRWDMDLATFGSAIRIRETGGMIQVAAVAFSGVAPMVLRLRETESFLKGQPLEELTFRQAGRIARSEIRPISDVRGSSDFRMQLAENVLMKFWLEVAEDSLNTRLARVDARQ